MASFLDIRTRHGLGDLSFFPFLLLLRRSHILSEFYAARAKILFWKKMVFGKKEVRSCLLQQIWTNRGKREKVLKFFFSALLKNLFLQLERQENEKLCIL